MKYLSLVIIGYTLLFMMGCTPKPGTLAKGSTAKYVIVIPDAPTAVEVTAAHDSRSLWSKASKISLFATILRLGAKLHG